MEMVLEQNQKLSAAQEGEAFGKKIGLAAAIFGCWHIKLSRPFTNGKRVSYVTCIRCGARKRFNPDTFATYGAFYYPPKISKLY